MTNAERQKRYRDKKRGGPPKGPWGGSPSVASIAEAAGIGRTIIFMVKWIDRHAPDVTPELKAGSLKATPTYKRLRREYEMGIANALSDQHATEDAQLMVSRRHGRFVFEWLKK